MRRFLLECFGCKVNQYDGQGLRERLLAAGLEEGPDRAEADLVVVQFCTVTARSAARGLRALRRLAAERPRAAVLAAGCLSPEDKVRVQRTCPRAWILPDTAPEAFLRMIGLQGRGSPARGEVGWGPVEGLRGHTRAFLKVQDGCNVGCAYCIIPSIRGAERSRPPAAVLREAKRLLERGYRELVLCGIRLGAYRSEGLDLAGLLREMLARNAGRFRLRLSSLNPAEVTEELLAVMQGDPRAAPHLHLPLQSGDTGVLRRMGRPYTPGIYLAKVERIRTVLEDPAITTDLMVGFPGEDEAAFERSLILLERAAAARVHVFPFSPRPGTRAAALEAVPEGVKRGRMETALAVAARLKERYDRSHLGRSATVLVEEGHGPGAGPPSGLTARYQRVLIQDGGRRVQKNRFVRVHLVAYDRECFHGTPVEEE